MGARAESFTHRAAAAGQTPRTVYALQRLLLVEFAATDRFHRAVEYPYFHGLARALGFSSRWLRFGVRAGVRFEHGDLGIGLEAAERQQLVDVATDHAATVVIYSRAPSAEVAAAVSEALPEARQAVLSEGSSVSDHELSPPLEPLSYGQEAWLRLLEVDPVVAGDGHDAALPDFEYEPGNEAAETMQPLPFVVLGQECTYNKSFARNPFFEGLDLDQAVRRGGCAFCTRPPNGPPGSSSTTADDMRLQLTPLAETLPEYPGRLHVRMVGEPAFRNLEVFGEVVAECGFEHTDFLFDTRADELVKREGELRRALGRIQAGNNRLHIALVGIENFARNELDRMNKGTDPLVNLGAVRTLLALESDFPATFEFRQHGGLSLILMSPWTSVEDFAVNLRVVRMCRLDALSGKVFSSRLRLHEGLPLLMRARADGLMIEAYDDQALDTAARNLYGVEQPWRFADPRMEGLCAILVRFHAEPGLDDGLTGRVSAMLGRARSAGRGPLDVASDLADIVLGTQSGEKPTEVLSADALLDLAAP